jgi:hypothetical protein
VRKCRECGKLFHGEVNVLCPDCMGKRVHAGEITAAAAWHERLLLGFQTPLREFTDEPPGEVSDAIIAAINDPHYAERVEA